MDNTQYRRADAFALEKLAAAALDMLVPHVVPGARTIDLDTMVYEFVRERGGVPATVFYKGYSHSSCISINHVVCHGIPSAKRLVKGDIANIDITVIVDGWHGDSSRMYYVGKAGVKAKKLVEVTHEALMRGIEVVRPGATLGDIGWAIQSFVEKQRFSVVRDFCGHGLGRVFHEPPNVVHFGKPGHGMVLKEGMFFTIEPMINSGKAETKILADGWTAVTKDKSLSAQFEHSLAVTATGCEIFTLSPAGLFCPKA